MERDHPPTSSLPICLQQLKLAQAEARSYELYLGLPHEWQGLYFLPPKVHISRQLGQKWSS